jgi:ribose 5-phosphate isomerase B
MWLLPVVKSFERMTSLDEISIQQIVERVLSQAMGTSISSHDSPALLPENLAHPMSQVPTRQSVAIGCDHGGYELKELLKIELNAMNLEIQDVGTFSKTAVDYPDYAHEVAKLVASGKAWRGIMIDGAGIGSCIVANKVPGVRAGNAYDLSSANNSREHNDTNVLTLGAGFIGVNLAKQIVRTWLTTEFGGNRHVQRIEKITAVEKTYTR